MPLSPALRRSPGREPRVVNHRRGRSLEVRVFRDKDDDLALFNEMQTKESDNFLLQSSDDFEDAFSTKLRHFSDYKLGVSIPAREESSDMLNPNKEKNDYDWLLTPPDTPLFRSLDDDQPPVNVAHRGRPRTQPISVSRSSTMGKSYRNTRGSTSPNRLSLSPQSGASMFQSRGRPSSTSNSSITCSQHAPSRRPSPPPNKHLTVTPRSTTPNSHRMRTGSGGGVASHSVRGISPAKTSRGSNASPKLRSWQTNIGDFSTDAPPNLRTALADRPTSYTRGSSPASRNNREVTSKFSRRSMSPAASRSVSSSHSHDRDPFSSHSKDSVVSSVDDEVDSGSYLAVPKRVGTTPKPFPKKSARLLSPSSAPIRSYDSALRQMDHHKSPHNMFRPLLSSVPSTTLYAGKASSSYRFVISRNSSVTTSSNASVPHDTEESDHNQDEMTNECGKLLDPDFQEVFAFDKPEAENDNIQCEIQGEPNRILHEFYGGPVTECVCSTSEDPNRHDTAIETSSASDTSYAKCDFSEVDNFESTLCSNCGCLYNASEPEELDARLCFECRNKDNCTIHSPDTQEAAIEISAEPPTNISEESKQFELLSMGVEYDQVADTGQPWVYPHEKDAKSTLGHQTPHLPGSKSLAKSLMEERDERLADQQEMDQPSVSYSLPDSDNGVKLLKHFIGYSNKMVDISHGAGISILLNRSSNSKGPVVEGKTLTATTPPYYEASYARDGTNNMRTSFGDQSASFSSSVSIKEYDVIEELLVTSQEEAPITSREETSVTSQEEMTVISQEERHVTSQEKMLASGIGEPPMPEERKCKCNEIANTDASASEASEFLGHTACCIPLEDKLMASVSNCTETSTFENSDNIPHNGVSVSEKQSLSPTPEACFTPLNISVDGVDVVEVPSYKSLISSSEIRIEDYNHSTAGSEMDAVSLKSNRMDDLEEPSVLSHLGLESGGFADPDTPDNGHATVVLEGSGSEVRSLTFEEATDTILFCSSIIHDLAYEAATVAIEKESRILLEESWPMVAVLEKSSTGRKPISGRIVGKHNLKSRKPKQRQVETDAKIPPNLTENDENIEECMPQIVERTNKVDSVKPPKLESKCNCTIM